MGEIITLRPIGLHSGDHAGTPSIGADIWQNVDESVKNEADYNDPTIIVTSVTSFALYNLEKLPAWVGKINSITLHGWWTVVNTDAPVYNAPAFIIAQIGDTQILSTQISPNVGSYSLHAVRMDRHPLTKQLFSVGDMLAFTAGDILSYVLFGELKSPVGTSTTRNCMFWAEVDCERNRKKVMIF